MEIKERCTFRYYEVLPLEIEPEYKLGYTCDLCSKDFTKGPFFHCARTGRDLCVICSEKLGLSPFSGLIGKVMVPDFIWKDSQKDSIVVLCYQIYFETYGFYFSDGSNLIIDNRDGVSSYFIDTGSSIEKATLLLKSDLNRRFPWVKEAIQSEKFTAVSFHPMTNLNDGTRLCFLTSFRQEEGLIEFLLSDGFCQVLHCSEGLILVIKDSFVLSCLVMNSPVRWGKALPKAALFALEWFLNSK